MVVRPVSLKDIARLSGYSAITVSRALNTVDDPHVSAEVRRKIRAIAERQGYVRSQVAGTLRSGRSRTIGLVMGGVSGRFQACMTHAFMNECLALGYRLQLKVTNYDREQEERALAEMLESAPDGIIYDLRLNPESGIARRLRDMKYPLLLMDSDKIKGFNSCRIDRDGVAERVLAEFAARGHRRIAARNAGDTERLRALGGRYGLDLHLVDSSPDARLLSRSFRAIAEGEFDGYFSCANGNVLNFLHYLSDHGHTRRIDCVGAYNLPCERVRDPAMIGAVTYSFRDYVTANLRRLLDLIEDPFQAPSHLEFPARYIDSGEALDLYREQIGDPYYAFFTS